MSMQKALKILVCMFRSRMANWTHSIVKDQT